MNEYFVPHENIVHPVTREPVLRAGFVYSRATFKAKIKPLGADIFDIRVILAPSIERAKIKAMNT
ncbi:hypothetical protein UFOVP128_1 [uncultured Caudovirales phage]|uniref:Uncharacterized protein n=1 Tax=uncultured Caudovirales phage TaxID=2100421 RepID=A0A6J7X132_9CAUD|nr:hypothetical protein UFOVP128_1 [uncultured Caudovirales phage]CAB5222074.1 hypothetical protein UFOVP243_43 [uncultured Caudovirales phage]